MYATTKTVITCTLKLNNVVLQVEWQMLATSDQTADLGLHCLPRPVCAKPRIITVPMSCLCLNNLSV